MILLDNGQDFTTTLVKALDEIDTEWQSYAGLIIAGTHSPKDIGYRLNLIADARINGTPFLGICFGHQLAAIEYFKNVLGIEDATSQEFGEGTYIVKKLPHLRVGVYEGETYWHNYEVDPDYLKLWTKPDHFITVQYHPEYQSSKEKPHPILVKFLELCKQ